MRVLLLGFTLSVLFAACSGKESIPSDVLPVDKMKSVLWDIIQAEKFSTQYIARDSGKNVKEETFRLYEDIFRIHNITRDKFVKSYKYYLTRPDITNVMFDSLSAEANRKRADVYVKPPSDSSTTKPMSDSIAKPD